MATTPAPVALTPTFLLYLIFLPLAGFAFASTIALISTRALLTRRPPSPRQSSDSGVLLTFLILPATLPIYAIIIFLVASSTLGDRPPEGLLESAAIALGIPALLTGVAQGLIHWRGVAVVLEHKELFGRILYLAVLPQTVALFGLISAFLILGQIPVAAISPDPVLEATRRASLFISVGALAAPLEALLMLRTWNFRTPKGFTRALLAAVAVEPLLLAGFVLGFLGMGRASP